MDNNPEISRLKQEGFIGQRMLVIPPDILQRMRNDPLTATIYPTAIGYYPNATYHDRKRQNGCKEFILLYCIQGEGTVNISGKQLVLKPNTFFIIPPDVPHHYKSSLENPWSIHWLHFTSTHSSRLYERFLPIIKPHTLKLAYSDERILQFHNILELLKESYSMANLDKAQIKLYHLLSTFMPISSDAYYTKNEDLVSITIRYMKENLEKSLKLEELSSLNNLSNSRYSELFKEKTGYAPIAYFIQLKMQQACQYLYFTDLSIKEICVKIGFEDPYYFSRMFKKIMGLPPSQYKSVYKK